MKPEKLHAGNGFGDRSTVVGSNSEMPRISIVVPVHDAGRNIARTLDAFRAQTVDCWEAVCIDDASSDDSPDVLAAYSQKDGRIKVFRNDTCKRAGWSRNRGMDEARGAYIMFCDADDWYEPDMCEKMLDAIERSRADLVQCHVAMELEAGATLPCGIDWFNPPVRWGGLFRRAHRGINTVCWNKIIRRSFLEGNAIRFTENNRHEDDLFCAECTIAVRKTQILPLPLYHYRVHAGSLMQSSRKAAEDVSDWSNNLEALAKWARTSGHDRSRLFDKFIRKWESNLTACRYNGAVVQEETGK